MKKFKKIMIIFISILAVLGIAFYLFMQQKTFGKNPSGPRLERIEKSPNYKNGSFQNLSPTEVMRKDASYFQMLKDYFSKPSTVSPSIELPSIKTDLKALEAETPTLVWFGHSSYLIKWKTKNILVDPVFSGNASPVSFVGGSFKGSDVYAVKDFPKIDLLVITHDHYDHLDYKTIVEFIPSTTLFVVPLGVGEHLEYWGVAKESTVELDWWEEKKISDSISFVSTPARHFSGRAFQRGKTLWTSYVLQLGENKIFIGGDSGYDTHFKSIGEKYGPFKFALLESGQYGTDWPLIHMVPEETVQAALDLKTEILMPVHWGKFVLAMHDWKEPIQRLTAASKNQSLVVTTPLIGEPVSIVQPTNKKDWWNK